VNVYLHILQHIRINEEEREEVEYIEKKERDNVSKSNAFDVLTSGFCDPAGKLFSKIFFILFTFINI